MLGQSSICVKSVEGHEKVIRKDGKDSGLELEEECSSKMILGR